MRGPQTSQRVEWGGDEGGVYNAEMRRLIVNADDFGLTAGVNRAIAEAHSNGIVSSATLMANASALGDAVRLASQLPRLSVGCHVVLVDGQPVLDAAQIPTLVMNHASGQSQFQETLGAFARRALSGRVQPNHVEAEAVAQIRKLQANGITVTHLDTHKHAHMFPAVYWGLFRAARACGVRAVRNPFSPRLPLSPTSLRERPGLWKRQLQVRALRSLEAGFLRAVAEAGLTTTEGSLGVVATGALDLSLFSSIVESIPPGTWEFVCHPGYPDSDLDKIRTRLKQSRVKELKILTSVDARQALERRGIQLISYRELV